MFQQHGKMLPIQASHLLHVIAYVEEKHSDELFTISLTSTTRDCDNCQFKGQNIMFNLFFFTQKPSLKIFRAVFSFVTLNLPLKLFCGIFFCSTKAATGSESNG